MAPPSPELRFLLAWKLKQPALPHVPTLRPFHSPRWAWQASSSTGTRWRWATARMVSRSAAEPPRCTGTIARVRSVIAASIRRASIWNVSMSLSTKMGRAPRSSTALTVATKV